MRNLLLIGTPIILLDQLTKGILLHMLSGGFYLFGNYADIVPDAWLITRVTSWFNIVFTWNPGTAFSLFREMGALFLITLTSVIIGFLGHSLLYRATDKTEKLALTLIIAGAIGNLIDRVRFGAVVDFIDWHLAGFHWPAFNVADIAISLGVMTYILYFVKERKNGRILKQ